MRLYSAIRLTQSAIRADKPISSEMA